MKNLTNGNIYKTFLLFAIPMVLAGVFSQCYSVVNTILAGKLLGDGALAAIGSVAPLETFINSIFWGYGSGVGIYVGQLFGAGDYAGMKRVVVSNYLFLSAAIVILSTCFVLFRYPLYSFLQVDPLLLESCNRYFIISMVGRVIVLFSINCVFVVNAMGDGAFPLWMSLVSTALNITVGVVSITQFSLGVEGLALGNVVSSAVVGALYLWKLSRSFKKVGVSRREGGFSFRAVGETCRYSLSTMVQQSVMYLAGLTLSPMVNGIGSAASASYTVSLRIYDISAAVYQNSAKTVGSYTAQCFGAKKYGLLKRGLVVGFLQNLLFVAPFLLVSSLLARPVVMLFFAADAAPLAVDYTVAFAQYCMPLLVMNIVANLFHNFFRGIGYMKALLITTITGSFARIIISWLLIQPFGIYGYYAGWVLSWLFDGAVGVLIYRFGKWRRILEKP
ncbi:MAG: hypothetical protein IJO76_03575 [Clostridia bacterium]|nr:hypothetical protein [Clostridia bacterium]